MLLSSAFLQALVHLIMGGLGLQNPVSYSHKSGEVAMLMIFTVAFLSAWGPLTYVVTTELPALRLRDRSQRIASIVNIFMNFLITFIIPYLMNAPYANLQGKVGFIFGSMSVLAFVFTYFCVPECKGRSLEEIDLMFIEGVPVRKFRTYRRIEIEVDAAKVDETGLEGGESTEHVREVAGEKTG
jgi:SP family sugar:H+ symporter-like MFS transporter